MAGADELAAEGAAFAAAHGLDGGFWVFAYGSLMWDPEIEHDRRLLAGLHGYHRRFCLYSHLYRGTPEAPGLLLGLDRGGFCRGMGIRVPAAAARAAWGVLWMREMVLRTYRPTFVRARTEEGIVPMVAFVAERASPQYCGALDEARMAAIIGSARGTRGDNRAYFENTRARLAELGIADRGMERLARLLATRD